MYGFDSRARRTRRSRALRVSNARRASRVGFKQAPHGSAPGIDRGRDCEVSGASSAWKPATGRLPRVALAVHDRSAARRLLKAEDGEHDGRTCVHGKHIREREHRGTHQRARWARDLNAGGTRIPGPSPSCCRGQTTSRLDPTNTARSPHDRRTRY